MNEYMNHTDTWYPLSDRRMLCWDDFAIEKADGVTVNVHKPEKKELAVVCRGEWEGIHSSYASVLRMEDGGYRMWMRSCPETYDIEKGYLWKGPAVFSVYESADGKTFRPVPVNRHEWRGIRENNIFHIDKRTDIDNFSVFRDENPACLPEEKYKALSAKSNGEGKGTSLLLYVSADGVDFREKRTLPLTGTFDTFNVLFWDPVTERYFVYYRDFHRPGTMERSEYMEDSIRDIRMATSKDLTTFEEHGMIRFPEGTEDVQLYTNQIGKYPRADDMFLGFPVRYVDRRDDCEIFDDMPLADYRSSVIDRYGRSGTALTETLIMTSRDGLHFDRRDESYLKPVSEKNWWYGECYTVYGLAETESDIPGAPHEISFYANENYRVDTVNFRRYTVRLDGFFSWHADAKGGSVLTKPFTFAGNGLEVNFETGVSGGLAVTVCDEAGEPLPGYESRVMFGDAVDRKVRFPGDLYSYQFH